MKLTRREKRAINRAVDAELGVAVADLGARVAEAEVNMARLHKEDADLRLHNLKIERHLRGSHHE